MQRDSKEYTIAVDTEGFLFPILIAVAMVRTYVAVWIVAWAFLATAVVVVGGHGKLTKCCPRDQILKIDLNNCEGYIDGDRLNRDSYNYSMSFEDKDTAVSDMVIAEDPVLSVHSNDLPWWVSGRLEFVKAANLSETFEPDDGLFDADGQMPCGMDDRDPIIIDEDVAVMDDGRLVMFEQATRSADDRPRLTFSSAEYCIDRVSLLGTLVASRDGHKKKNRRDVDAAAAAVTATATVATGATTDETATYAYLLLVCRPCSRMTCVPKCCNQNHILEYKKNEYTGCHKAQSVADAHAAIHLKASNGTELKRKDYYFYGLRVPDCDGRGVYLLNESGVNGTVDYSLMPDGRVAVDGGEPIGRDEYCVDALNVVPDGGGAPNATRRPAYRHVMLACRQTPGDGPLNFRDVLYGVYFVVGAVFLAATLLIYAALPELRVTVHSGNLIAHTVCLFVSYATLAATTLAPHAFNDVACVIAAFVIQFSFLAAFFWLNVMCADIAWTFSGFRLLSYTNTIENEKKKYIIYSIYAWSCSIGITVFTALAEFTHLFGYEKYKPGFGHNSGCWFSNKFSVGVFFYLPIGLLLLTNFILFLFTAFRIISTHANTSRVLNRQTNQNNMRLSLYLKLFCLMGVTFVFEVISWAVEAPPQYWYATDAINSLRGVFVFFIFCWKRSVLDHLLARAPKRARDRFVRAFGLGNPNRFPSFSSAGQPNHGSVRNHCASLSAQYRSGSAGSTFQLSQFSNSASAQARKNSSARQ